MENAQRRFHVGSASRWEMATCVGVKDRNHPVLTGSYHPHSLILPLEVLVSQPVNIQTGICSAFAVLEEWGVSIS